MSQRTLRFKIRQDGRVEETVEGIVGEGCIDLTEKLCLLYTSPSPRD